MFHNPDFAEETYLDNLQEFDGDNNNDFVCGPALLDNNGISSWDGLSSIELILNESATNPNNLNNYIGLSDQKSNDDNLNTNTVPDE